MCDQVAVITWYFSQSLENIHEDMEVISAKFFATNVIHFKQIPDDAITNVTHNCKPAILLATVPLLDLYQTS